jgi:glycosyltransferase involved in cell wall biosynthesis
MNGIDASECWHIAVLIPARDEERLLPRCLRSVLAAQRVLPPGVTSEIVVVSDGSTDSTACIARDLLSSASGAVLEVTVRRVGTARACAAAQALHRFKGPKERCWLANTDADCEVPATWLSDQLSFARKGWNAVAGIIDVDSFAEHAPHVPMRFRQTYTLRADGSHPHIHGANLGIRADAYLAAGGWADLETAEDHDLWGRLDPAQRLSSTELRVMTSGRVQGRAPMGFADALARHNQVVL